MPGKTASTHSISGRYEIKVAGHLDAHWSASLGGLSITHDPQGVTHLSGTIPDQAALYGVLNQLRDLGLPLVAVTCLDEEGKGQG